MDCLGKELCFVPVVLFVPLPGLATFYYFSRCPKNSPKFTNIGKTHTRLPPPILSQVCAQTIPIDSTGMETDCLVTLRLTLALVMLVMARVVKATQTAVGVTAMDRVGGLRLRPPKSTLT
tara:strand:- start:431 stop:790 length:360 start_codon:yes stop_codon:yes gene_type:complete